VFIEDLDEELDARNDRCLPFQTDSVCGENRRLTGITKTLDDLPISPIDGDICESVSLFVPRTQRVPDREALKSPAHLFGLPEERNQIGVLDPVAAEHLIDKEKRVGNDLELGRALGPGERESLDQAGVLSDVIGRPADEP